MHTNKICFTNQFIFNLNNKCHRCPLYSCQRGFLASRIWCPPWWTSPNMQHPQVFRCIAVDQKWSIIYRIGNTNLFRVQEKMSNHVKISGSSMVQTSEIIQRNTTIKYHIIWIILFIWSISNGRYDTDYIILCWERCFRIPECTDFEQSWFIFWVMKWV